MAVAHFICCRVCFFIFFEDDLKTKLFWNQCQQERFKLVRGVYLP